MSLSSTLGTRSVRQTDIPFQTQIDWKEKSNLHEMDINIWDNGISDCPILPN